MKYETQIRSDRTPAIHVIRRLLTLAPRDDSKSARDLMVEQTLANSPVPQFQLCDLSRARYEKTNVIAQHPQIAEQMKERVAKYIADGRSRTAGK
jgi:hypothetical protein